MKHAIVLGSNSSIYQAMRPMMLNDGWILDEWNRDKSWPNPERWDVVLCLMGQVAPVGNWFDHHPRDVEDCFNANLLLPLEMLREMWAARSENAKVCFLAGSNPQKIMPGYLPYNVSKMALLKAVEQMDAESPDCTIFALGPGYVRTKIHQATLEANWPNERIARGDDGTPIEQIYDCLRWCLEQPKEVVGGRNVCASDPFGPGLADILRDDPSMFKLRRIEP